MTLMTVVTVCIQEEDERIKQKDEEFIQQIETNLDEFEDEFMKEYRMKRLQEMRQMFANL